MASRRAERVLFVVWCVLLLVAAEFISRRFVPLEQVPRWKGFHVADSLAAYRLAPHLHGEIYFNGHVPIRTNSLGLRDKEYGGRAPGVPRVLMIGDSQTLGLVPEPATLARRLQRVLERRSKGIEIGFDGQRRRLDRWEVINAGVLGYGTEQELIRMRWLLPLYQPDLVVLTVFPNDFYDNRYRPRERWFVGDDGYLHSKTEAPHPLPAARAGVAGISDWLATHVNLYALGRRTLARMSRGPSRPAAAPEYAELLARDSTAEAARDWARTDSLIGEVVGAARTAGARLVLVDGGSRGALDWSMWPAGTDTTRYDLDREAHALERVASRNGVPCVHVMPAFRTAAATGAALYFPNDDHWTARGNDVAAEAVAPAVFAALGIGAPAAGH